MSVRQRLYPTVEQVAGMEAHCAHARFVWNVALEQANMWRPDGPAAPSNAERMRQLAEARQAFDWLAAGSSSVQQGALRDFDRAMRNWWSGTHRHPTWRKQGIHEGFVVRDLTVHKINGRWATVLVPKVGEVKFRLTRAWTRVLEASSARVTRDRAGRWHVSLVCEPKPIERAPTGAAVGIDRGVANTIATSDGTFGHAPSLTAGEQRRYLALSRRLARQKKGSNRRARTKVEIGQLSARLVDRRRDWVEQTTTRLVRDYDFIGIERLNTPAMVRRPQPKPDPDNPGTYLPNGARAKAGLNRAIHAQCWGLFAQRLKYKAEHASRSVVVVEVDPRFSSQECRRCNHVAAENRESQAVFACQSCGHEAHADTNAAGNILDRAQSGYAAGHGRERTHKPRTASRVNHLEEALP